LPLSFEPGVAQKVRIDGAVLDGEAETWHKDVFDLFPDL